MDLLLEGDMSGALRAAGKDSRADIHRPARWH
jgi:hypothetical protein